MSTFKMIMGILGALVLMIAIAFLLELGGLKWQRFFAPKRENIRREVFKETRSYNESKVQDLARFRLQYMKAESSEREAIASTIRVMFADYEASDIPVELYAFLQQVRGY